VINSLVIVNNLTTTTLPLYATQDDLEGGSVKIAQVFFSSHNKFSNVSMFHYIMVNSYNP
jgi:hypothetical protein